MFCLPACISQRNRNPGHPQMESAAPQETTAGAEVSSTELTKAHQSTGQFFSSIRKHYCPVCLSADTFTSPTSLAGTSSTCGSMSMWHPMTRSEFTCFLTDWSALPAASENNQHPLTSCGFEQGETECVLFLSRYSSSMKTLNNKFMHLTNYSVNKKNSEYQANSDDKACQGHKW